MIRPELAPVFLLEESTVPFNLIGVQQTHYNRGNVIVPVSCGGVIMVRCCHATIYITQLGRRCILGSPLFARSGIHVNIAPVCSNFEGKVGKVATPDGLAARTDAALSHIWLQQQEPKCSARGSCIASHIDNEEHPEVLTSCNEDVQFRTVCSSGFSNRSDACVRVVLLCRYINFHCWRA